MSDDFDEFCESFGTITPEGSVAWHYYEARAKELINHGYFWINVVEEVDGGFCTYFYSIASDREMFVSFYVNEANRGQGKFPKFLQTKWIELGKPRFITVPFCNLVDFFEKFSVPYLCVEV